MEVLSGLQESSSKLSGNDDAIGKEAGKTGKYGYKFYGRGHGQKASVSLSCWTDRPGSKAHMWVSMQESAGVMGVLCVA